MRLPARTLAAALVAAAIPLYAGSASAAPLSQSLALSNTDVGQVEQVQYRRWNRGRWIGPAAAGLAAGAIIGGVLASSQYDDSYYAYGAEPGYSGEGPDRPGYYVGDVPGINSGVRLSPQWGSCTGDRDNDSSYPSWACR